jgi:hypothetical protein
MVYFFCFIYQLFFRLGGGFKILVGAEHAPQVDSQAAGQGGDGFVGLSGVMIQTMVGFAGVGILSDPDPRGFDELGA